LKNMKRQHLIAFLFSCSLLATINAQTKEKVPAQSGKVAAKSVDEKESLLLQRRAKAINLVNSVTSDAPKWENKETAIRVLAEAADLLWDEDEISSRSWLQKAWDLTSKVEEKRNDETMRQFWRGSYRSKLKSIALEVAARRDSKLADKFLRQLQNETESGDSERGAFDDRTTQSEQLLRIALGLIESNPALAASLAERSLADGVSFNFQTVLVLLKQRDINLANRLFDAAVARVSANPNTQLSELQILQSFLFSPGLVSANGANGQTILAFVAGQNPNAAPMVDAVRARNFLTAAHRILFAQQLPVDETSAVKFSQDFVLLSNTLAPHFRSYAPDLSVAVAAKTAQFAAKLPKNRSLTATDEKQDESAKTLSPEKLYQKRIDELEAKAETENDPIAKKLAFAEAALNTNAEDFERGRFLAGKIEEEQLREEVLAFIFYRAALTYLEKGEIDKAIELSKKTPQSLNRAVALISIAHQLTTQKAKVNEEKWQAEMRRQQAIDLLFEAEKSFKRDEISADTARVLLGRVAVLALLDKSQAQNAFSEAIATINKVESFEPTDAAAPRLGLEGFGTSRFTVPRLSNGYGFRNALKPLIEDNFDVTIGSINNALSPSVRGACLLEAARFYLLSNRLPQNANAKVIRQ
jgi:hypothetical protein